MPSFQLIVLLSFVAATLAQTTSQTSTLSQSTSGTQSQSLTLTSTSTGTSTTTLTTTASSTFSSSASISRSSTPSPSREPLTDEAKFDAASQGHTLQAIVLAIVIPFAVFFVCASCYIVCCTHYCSHYCCCGYRLKVLHDEDNDAFRGVRPQSGPTVPYDHYGGQDQYPRPGPPQVQSPSGIHPGYYSPHPGYAGAGPAQAQSPHYPVRPQSVAWTIDVAQPQQQHQQQAWGHPSEHPPQQQQQPQSAPSIHATQFPAPARAPKPVPVPLVGIAYRGQSARRPVPAAQAPKPVPVFGHAATGAATAPVSPLAHTLQQHRLQQQRAAQAAVTPQRPHLSSAGPSSDVEPRTPPHPSAAQARFAGPAAAVSHPSDPEFELQGARGGLPPIRGVPRQMHPKGGPVVV